MRYARVCPNAARFHHPDDGNKGGIGTTFPGQYGFGYEEWLGRTEWVWDGPRFDWMDPATTDYRCGYLQAVRRQPVGIVHDIELYELTASQRLAVGHIHGCRRLTPDEIQTVYDTGQATGRLDVMQQELDAATAQALRSHRAEPYPHRLADLRHTPHEIFNLCFPAPGFRLLATPERRPYPHSRYGNLYR